MPIPRNPREENHRIKNSEVPNAWGEAKRAQKDGDGRWTGKRGKRSFGTRSKTRSRVEHVFGFQENSMGGKFIRTIGLARATVEIGMMNLTYNLMRYLQLMKGRDGAPAAA